MSAITGWLQQHARRVAAAATGALWQLHEPQLVSQLVSLLSCTLLSQAPQHYLCQVSQQEFWHVHEMVGHVYVQSFQLKHSPATQRNSWLGELVVEQWFEHYHLQIFSSPHRTSALVQAAELRLAQRIVSLMEISHGRYHAQLANPEASLLFIPDAQSNYSVLITKGAKRR